MRKSRCRIFSDFYCPIAAGYRDGNGILPYDKAATRAENICFRPPKNLPGNPDRTIFIGRLPEDLNEAAIEKAFSTYGAVEKVSVIRDIVTGLSRGYGFVLFASSHSADKAWRDGHILCVRGADIIVEKEHGRTMKNWKPRRFGGGLGGKKESGQLRFGGSARPFVSAPDWLSSHHPRLGSEQTGASTLSHLKHRRDVESDRVDQRSDESRENRRDERCKAEDNGTINSESNRPTRGRFSSNKLSQCHGQSEKRSEKKTKHRRDHAKSPRLSSTRSSDYRHKEQHVGKIKLRKRSKHLRHSKT